MFECWIEDPAGVRPGNPPGYLGLNEITIQNGPPFHMIELDLSLDGELLPQ